MMGIRERRESSRSYCHVPILVICRTMFLSLLLEGMYIKDILQADTSQLVHYRSYRSMCVSVSPMISIRIPVIYVQYPSFERDHPYYRVYISQCAAGRHEIALVIFLRCSAFTVLAGHRKEWR